jgi:hypothetical protein
MAVTYRPKPSPEARRASRRFARFALGAAALAVLGIAFLALRPAPEKPVPPPPPPPPLPAVGPRGAGPPRRLKVVVSRLDGAPCTGCRLVILGEGRSSTVVRAFAGADDLAAEFDLYGDRARLVAVPEEADVALEIVDLGPDVKSPVRVVLPPGTESFGQVVDPRDQPLAGRRVKASLEVPAPPPGIDDFAQVLGDIEVAGSGPTLSVSASTDATGRFRLPHLLPSVSNVEVLVRQKAVKFASGRGLRLVLPDDDGR